MNRLLLRAVLTPFVLIASFILAACGVLETGGTSAQFDQPSVSPMPAASPNLQVPQSSSLPQGGTLRSMRLTAENSGWILTDTGIWWTNDFTRNWMSKPLPSKLQSQDIGNIFFLNEQSGWIVSQKPRPGASNPADLIVLRTTDGGGNWTTSSLYPGYSGYIEPLGGWIEIEFVDAQYGWVMLQAQTSPVFSIGLLFRTTDGGASWSRVSTPSGESFHFINPSDGWAINTPLERIYSTHDGGVTWQEQPLPDLPREPVISSTEDKTAPPAENLPLPTYELPTFFNQTEGVLAVTLAGEAASVNFYVTHDGGRSWYLASTVATSINGTLGTTVPTAALTPDEWIVFVSDQTLQRTTSAGAKWENEHIPTLPSGGIDNLSFSSITHGWAQSSVVKCAEYKARCSVYTQLTITEDMGHTWQPIIELMRPT